MRDFFFEYDASSKVLAVRVVGAFTDDIFKACYGEATRHVAGQEILGALMDLSKVERFEISAEAVRQVSVLPPAINDPVPRYVVASQAHIFGMARMFQIISPKGRDALRIVRTLKDAYDGLGVTTPQFERLPDLP